MNMKNELCDNCMLNYWAGLFDGEGSITIITHKVHRKYNAYVLKVSIANNYRPVLEDIQTAFGGSIHPIKGSNCFDFSVQAERAVQLLKDLLPFLQIKKRRVEFGIYFQENRPKPHGRRGYSKKEWKWFEDAKQKMEAIKW